MIRSIGFVLIAILIAFFLPGGIIAVGAFIAKRVNKRSAGRKFVA